MEAERSILIKISLSARGLVGGLWGSVFDARKGLL